MGLKKIVLPYGSDTEVCHGGIPHFLRMVADGFLAIGYDAVVCPFPELIKHLDSADALLLMNGVVGAKLPSGTYFYDGCGVPIVNFIIDPPRIHHENLSVPLSRYYCVCLAEEHADYIRETYPHIKDVCVGYLTPGPVAEEELIPFGSRKYDLIFTGNYTDYEEAGRQMDSLPAVLKEAAKKTLKEAFDHPMIPTHELLRRSFAGSPVLPETKLCIGETDRGGGQSAPDVSARIPGSDAAGDMPAETEAALLNMVENYLHGFYRKELISYLTENEIDVYVFGRFWERFEGANSPFFHAMGPIGYEASLRAAADSKMVLNSMPLFKDGIHDRIPTAMQRGSIIVTNTSRVLERDLDGRTDSVVYDLTDYKEKLADRLKEILGDPVLGAQIAKTGYEKAKGLYSMETVARSIAGMLF